MVPPGELIETRAHLSLDGEKEALKPLYLRIDVCTYRGLRDGVPAVLSVLRRAKARATFFVTMGPDASGLALLKLLNPAFAWKMLRTKAGSTYGWATAFYGTLLPSPMVGSGLPDLVRQIRSEGHEVGAHGWDHRRWQDRLPRYDPSRLREEYGRMREAYQAALGVPPDSFAAPAWRVSSELLGLEAESSLAFASDARGTHPFLPTFEGRDYPIPQIPVTLPTLDERLGTITQDAFVDEVVSLAARQTEYCCFAAHAESEGRAHQAELSAILARVDRPAVPLGEAPRSGLPRAPMAMGRVPGRPYDLCVQA
jgi:peptidoglycan/xylan/chitin deacetylase (PgdA/CDA1 family)